MPVSQQPLKLEHMIICDDIRKEANGKLILIGVYSGDILLSRVPAPFSPAIYLTGKGYTVKNTGFDFKVVVPGSEFEGRLNLEVSSGREFAINIPAAPLQILQPGELKFQYRLAGGRWRTLGTKKVRLSPSSPRLVR